MKAEEEERFFFQQRRGRLKLRRFAHLDIDQVVKDVDIDLLQSHLEDITFCNLREEDIKFLSDPLLVKLFRTSQLMIEYLLYSQTQLAGSLTNLAEKYSNQKKSLVEKRKELIELKELSSHLEEEVSTKKRGLSVLEALLAKANEEKIEAGRADSNSNSTNESKSNGMPSDKPIRFSVVDGKTGVCIELTENPTVSIGKILSSTTSGFKWENDDTSVIKSIKLALKGKILSNFDYSIEDYGIQEGATLVAMVEREKVTSNHETHSHSINSTSSEVDKAIDVQEMLKGQERMMKGITNDLRETFENMMKVKQAKEEEVSTFNYDPHSLRQESAGVMNMLEEMNTKFESGLRQQLDAQLVHYEHALEKATNVLRKSGAGDLEESGDEWGLAKEQADVVMITNSSVNEDTKENKRTTAKKETIVVEPTATEQKYQTSEDETVEDLEDLTEPNCYGNAHHAKLLDEIDGDQKPIEFSDSDSEYDEKGQGMAEVTKISEVTSEEKKEEKEIEEITEAEDESGILDISELNDTKDGVKSFDKSIDQSIDQFVDQSVDQSIDKSTDGIKFFDNSIEISQSENTEIVIEFPRKYNKDLSHIESDDGSDPTISVPADITVDDLFFELRREISLLTVVPAAEVDFVLDGVVVDASSSVVMEMSAADASNYANLGTLVVKLKGGAIKTESTKGSSADNKTVVDQEDTSKLSDKVEASNSSTISIKDLEEGAEVVSEDSADTDIDNNDGKVIHKSHNDDSITIDSKSEMNVVVNEKKLEGLAPDEAEVSHEIQDTPVILKEASNSSTISIKDLEEGAEVVSEDSADTDIDNNDGKVIHKSIHDPTELKGSETKTESTEETLADNKIDQDQDISKSSDEVEEKEKEELKVRVLSFILYRENV